PFRKQIDDLQALIDKERKAILQRIRNEYEASLSREAGLRKAYAAEAGNATGNQDKAAQYGLLKREVSIYQTTLNQMLQQVSQASVVAAVPANNIRIVDMAFTPRWPVAPDVKYYIGL